MDFIVATTEHLDRMCEITDQAKRQLRNLGLDQWQRGYPSREVWTQDAEDGCSYLAVEEGEILGVFAFQTTPDPSYAVIDGEWLTDGEYASMHRVCVSDDCKGKGVAGKMFAYGFEMARKAGFCSVRIDTHPGNLPMQRALAKAGFVACGEIRLVGGCEDGDLRIGFEKMLCSCIGR
ncbi:N-acetyltransferase family protein [Bariatricus sp. SGI.154]|uniref:GNAT family N-acetyltransferase n=1 Tax=Bariatricus sp. SGI.154 TaxID=3420549 RepID=UPI003D074786